MRIQWENYLKESEVFKFNVETWVDFSERTNEIKIYTNEQNINAYHPARLELMPNRIRFIS